MKQVKAKHLNKMVVFVFILYSFLSAFYLTNASFDSSIISLRRVRSMASIPIFTRDDLLTASDLQQLYTTYVRDLNGNPITGGFEEKDIPSDVISEVKKLLAGNAVNYGLLLNHLLNPQNGSGIRLKFKVDEEISDESYTLPSGGTVRSFLEMEYKYRKDEYNEDCIAYIHVTKGFWDAHKDDPTALANVIISEYQKSFMPEYILDKNFTNYSVANRLAEIAKHHNKKDSQWFFDQMQTYDSKTDTAGVIKRALLEEIKKIDISQCRNSEQLLLWYRARIELGVKLDNDLQELVNKKVPPRIQDLEGKIQEAEGRKSNLEQDIKNIEKDIEEVRELGESSRNRKQIAELQNKIEEIKEDKIPDVEKEIEKLTKKLDEVKSIKRTLAVIQLSRQIQNAIEEHKIEDRLISSFFQYTPHVSDTDIYGGIFNNAIFNNGEPIWIPKIDINPKSSASSTAVDFKATLDGLLDKLDSASSIDQLLFLAKNAVPKGEFNLPGLVAQDFESMKGNGIELDFGTVRDDLILAIHNNDAVNIVADVIIQKLEKGEKHILVSLPGSGGAGKSTFAKHLQLALKAKYKELNKELNTHQLSTDDYLYDRTHRYAPRDLEDGVEMQGAMMYNWQRLIADMQAFTNGGKFYVPEQYKDEREIKLMDWYNKEVQPDVFILEGCLADHGAALQELIDVAVGITGSDANRLNRKVARDVKDRGQSEGWIIYDFAAKQFHERTDIIKNDLKTKADFIWEYDENKKKGQLYFINPNYHVSRWKDLFDQLYADLSADDIEESVLV